MSHFQVNEFVKTFVECVNEAGSYVHQTNIRLRPPKKVYKVNNKIRSNLFK